MPTKLEEIIFSNYGIDLSKLNEDQIIDPTRIEISPNIHEKTIQDIKAEYNVNDLEVNLILLNYGASVKEELEDEIRLLDGYIRKKKWGITNGGFRRREYLQT